MYLLFVYEDDGSVMRSVPRIHFLDELKRAGHTLIIFNPLEYPDVEQFNEALAKAAGTVPVDLMVSLHGDELVRPETVVQFKRRGIPTLLFCFDNLQAPYMQRQIASLFDLVWLSSFETMPLFKSWGCTCIFLPYAANPHVFQPRFTTEIPTVGFIGTPYGTRVMKINDLLKGGVPCSLYSDYLLSNSSSEIIRTTSKNKRLVRIDPNDWNLIRFPIGRRILWSKVKKKITPHPQLLESDLLHIHSSVSLEEMNCLYSNFALSLGITEVWDTYLLRTPVHKIHLRTFEIPMCGGLQFAPYLDELAGYFEDGKEIVLYRTKEEYIDKAKFYLRSNKGSERRIMKINARKRAEQEHTWINRFNNVFKIMFPHHSTRARS